VCFIFTLHLCIWQTLLSKVTYVAFNLHVISSCIPRSSGDLVIASTIYMEVPFHSSLIVWIITSSTYFVLALVVPSCVPPSGCFLNALGFDRFGKNGIFLFCNLVMENNKLVSIDEFKKIIKKVLKESCCICCILIMSLHGCYFGLSYKTDHLSQWDFLVK